VRDPTVILPVGIAKQLAFPSLVFETPRTVLQPEIEEGVDSPCFAGERIQDPMHPPMTGELNELTLYKDAAVDVAVEQPEVAQEDVRERLMHVGEMRERL
jgi:hypothetical protein